MMTIVFSFSNNVSLKKTLKKTFAATNFGGNYFASSSPCRYGKFFDLVPAGQEYFKQSASRPRSKELFLEMFGGAKKKCFFGGGNSNVF